MKCPNCRGEVTASADRCPVCQTPLSSSVVVGVLTPAPGSNEETVFSSGAPLSLSPDGTTLNTSPGDTTGLPTSAGGVRHAAPATAATGPLQVSQQFSSRYLIVRLLGIGGMGAVYQAWDAELSVMVALKVVRPEVTRDPAAARDIERRFKQELLLARQITHKNVVRIHDLGEIDGIKYITMPYIEGEDLATVLKQSGKLPVARVMPIATQIAAGLQAAHEAGVVHRDLKPANIMVEKDGQAIIMDFGIARTAAHTEPRVTGAVTSGRLDTTLDEVATRATATVAGAVIGTIEYMAPEQARGEEVDQRADIYAFGLILYDMLVGRRRAEHAGSAIAELQSRLEHAPPPLRSIVPEVPDALYRFVSRCVEPDAAKRYATTADMVAALSRLDDHGKLRPVKRVVRLPLAVAVASLLLTLSGYIWWNTRPPVQHDPVSVVIADMVNGTGDAAFDGTLEPMLRRALEDAGFITAYDRNGIRGLGVPARDRLDEVAAREIAVQQGLGVVLSGSIEPQGGGYRIAVKATHTVTGDVIADQQARAAGKDQVLEVATGLITRVRNALGDDTSESAQQFAMASLSATSLDVVRLYVASMGAASSNRFAEARQYAAQAVDLDPNFGIGYLLMAVASRNMGRLDDNQTYLDQALSHLDGMTERERYQTRGYSHWATGDYEQCVQEFTDLIARYPGDVAGRNQLALCLSNLREMRRAMEEVQAVVKILPSHPLFRVNLALYANYAGDFQTAEQEARTVEGGGPYAALALALAQLGQGQIAQARETYAKLGQIDALGASFSASGLGDLAAFEGRFSDAVRILRKGAADDLAADSTDSAAAKLVAAAYAELSRGRLRPAIEAAAEALGHSSAVKIRFLAARTFVEAGDVARARPIMNDLAKELYAEPRAYAKILEGDMALKGGDARQAMNLLREANDLFDTWIGFFDLGRASLAAGAFTQADSAFDMCLNARRGEALSLFVDEEPTYAYFPPVYYYQGRVREGLKSAGFAESYRGYLAIRGNSSEDPLVPQLRKLVNR